MGTTALEHPLQEVNCGGLLKPYTIEKLATPELVDSFQVQEQSVSQPEPPSAKPRARFSYKTAKTTSLIDRFIDEPRHLNVAVIGGGLAGIIAGVLLPQKVPGVQLTILEKNENFGGTWLENTYPGVRCDIPSHVYQATFAPKKTWSDKFAPGDEIKTYWQDVARKYNVYKYAKFGQRVDSAVWHSAHGSWELYTTDLSTKIQYTTMYDFVITATGRFNDWQLPKYPGLADFKGHLRHSSNWDASFDPSDKAIAVIGNGASGIQVVANLQKKVKRLDHYVRNKTWIATSWAGDERTLASQPMSADERQDFDDDDKYLTYRKKVEDKYWRRFDSFFSGTANNEKLKDQFTEVMRRRLAKKPELIDSCVPDFSPNCRRLTPGPGYLEAIVEDNVDYITTKIRRFTETGIETEDGVHRAVDAVICATGSRSDLIPQFPVTANGQSLGDLWKQDGPHGFPYTYLGLATPGFPNLVFVHGPHGTGASGTVPQSVETQVTLVAKILRKISREGIKSMQPSTDAADDFIEYSDAFFSKTVLADGCSSWYNGGVPGGRIHGLWPGSAAHLSIIRREPRWEDWKYEYLSDNGNRFLWYFGNGWTAQEGDPEADLTSYLHKPGEISLRDLHEPWWNLP